MDEENDEGRWGRSEGKSEGGETLAFRIRCSNSTYHTQQQSVLVHSPTYHVPLYKLQHTANIAYTTTFNIVTRTIGAGNDNVPLVNVHVKDLSVFRVVAHIVVADLEWVPEVVLLLLGAVDDIKTDPHVAPPDERGVRAEEGCHRSQRVGTRGA